MRLGCARCLGTVTGFLLVAALAAGAVIGTVRALEPPAPAADLGTREDGLRGQRKLGAVVGLGRRGRRAEPIVLSEPEVNALLSRHLLAGASAPLSDVAVHLAGDDRAEVAGRLPLGMLLAGWPLSSLAARLPEGWVARSVWVVITTRVRVERRPRPSLDLIVERFSLGRQPLPVVVLRVLLDPGTIGTLRWPLPGEIDDVRVEPGRVLIRPAVAR